MPPRVAARAPSAPRPTARDGRRRVAARAAPTPEEATRAAALRAQEAKSALTRRRVRETLEAREREREARERAAVRAASAARRARAREAAMAIGGRAPYHRKAGPIGAAAATTAVGAWIAFESTTAVGDYFVRLGTSGGVDGRTVMAMNGMTTLSVGVGVTLTSTLVFSAVILFLLALQEARYVVMNEPVIFYRCDGADPSCCVNGPHNKGYNERFVYMNHGRGFETRRVQCMQRHLKVSKKCSMLEPLIVYPKDEKWGFW